jgi:hypothetical protein
MRVTRDCGIGDDPEAYESFLPHDENRDNTINKNDTGNTAGFFVPAGADTKISLASILSPSARRKYNSSQNGGANI